MTSDSEAPDPVCYTRADYRAGRKETAVRVYTVNQESRYLIVRNVPSLNCLGELLSLFSSYGPIEESGQVAEPQPEFTESYRIKFCEITNARFAKRKLDDFSFFGALLKVVYSPESESQTDTWLKLEERRNTVLSKIGAFSKPHTSRRPSPHPHPHPRQEKALFSDPLLSLPPPPPPPPPTHEGSRVMRRPTISTPPEIDARCNGVATGEGTVYNKNGFSLERNNHMNTLLENSRSNTKLVGGVIIGPRNSDTSLSIVFDRSKKIEVLVRASRSESDILERMSESNLSILQNRSIEGKALIIETSLKNGESKEKSKEVVNKRSPSDKRRRI